MTAGGLYFWDQVTAALVADESYGTFHTAQVGVVVDEDRSVAGTTLIAGTGTQLRVVDSIDVARFETDFLSAIAGTDVGPITIDSDLTGSFDGKDWSLDLPETLSPGEYIIHVTNSGSGEIALAFGWLTGDATTQDLDEREGIAQPPFYELESLLYGFPRSEIVSPIEFASEERYVIVGLDIAAEESTTLGIVDVTDN